DVLRRIQRLVLDPRDGRAQLPLLRTRRRHATIVGGRTDRARPVFRGAGRRGPPPRPATLDHSRGPERAVPAETRIGTCALPAGNDGRRDEALVCRKTRAPCLLGLGPATAWS